MRYKGTKKPLPEIAGELDVDAVVEGTVLRSGTRVRIDAQLLRAAEDRQLWAESYERDVQDVLSLQSDVARAIANEIKVQLTPEDQARLASSRRVNPDAYEAYLRGRFEWNRLTAEGFKKALPYYQQAIAKDPSYAPAYTGLADCYFKLADWGVASPAEVIPKSKAAALKAIALDDALGEPHASLAIAALEADWDWAAAESEFKRSLTLSPNYSVAHAWYGLYLVAVNKPDEAVAEGRKAQALDPGAQITNLILACIYFYAHQYGQSIAQHRKTLTLFPDSEVVHWYLAEAYEQKGMCEEAVTEYLKVKALVGSEPEALAGLQQAYVKSGMKSFWQKELALSMAAPKAEAASASGLAVIFTRLGDKGRAFERLESAFQARDFSMVYLRCDPRLANLHSAPRFQDLLRRMNFPP
jgi:tetratricopeptide (TPR) repeat protein